MNPPLTALKMEWHQVDDDHDELVVGMPVLDNACTTPADFPHITTEQLADAAEFGAGILGRLSTRVQAEITLEAKEHGCLTRGSVFRSDSGQVIVDGCNVSGSAALLTPRSEYTDEAPALWIVVPRGHITAWRQRINGWLQQIADDHPVAVTTPHATRSTA